jgi:hypothetical protein
MSRRRDGAWARLLARVPVDSHSISRPGACAAHLLPGEELPREAVAKGRLARSARCPDCVKIELKEIKRATDERELFESMGRETANIHLGASPSRVRAIRDDLARRGAGWLAPAATRLAEDAREDWRVFARAASA